MMHQTDKVGADKIIRRAVANTKMYLGNARMDPGFVPSGGTPTYYLLFWPIFPQKLHDMPDVRTLK